VLVSPNMSYPALTRQAALTRIDAIDTHLPSIDDTAQRTSLIAERSAAQQVANDISADATSIVGLRAPLVNLRNPGIISIPIGFLLVVLVSLFTRDRRAEARWPELVVRRETGYGVAAAVEH
jgi:cation/acetate symporter